MSYEESNNFYGVMQKKNIGLVSGGAANPTPDAQIDQIRESNLKTNVRIGTLASQKYNRRQDIMENFRMRILRNLDLAVEIIIDEGQIVLKKYDKLDFYLKKISNGNIYEFKAVQQIKQLRKQLPDASNIKGSKTLKKGQK